MKHMERIVMIITAIAVMIGGQLLAASVASADTTITVESVSYSDATASANVTKEERALINGRPQVTWQDANYGVKLTTTAVKAAWYKRIKVIATGANSSQVIYKKTKRQLVVLKPGSKVRNTGRHNQSRVGFVWTIQRPAILKYDKASHQYRHAADLLTKTQLDALQNSAGSNKYRVVGKVKLSGTTYYIVIWCGNYIGGNVTIVSNPVILRYESDVQLDIDLEANASVKAKVEASLQCDSGKLYGYAEATASATASASIRVKSGVKVSAVNAKKIELLNQVNASAKAKAEAQAKAKITLTCTDTPSYSAPVISANASPCTQQGQQPGIVTVSAKNDNNVTVPVTYSFPGRDNKTGSIAAGQTGTVEFTGVLPGTYTVSVSFGAPVNKSVTTQVTVAKCEVPPAPPTIVDMTRPNDTNPGWTTPACATADFPQGHSGTLFFSFESGTVSGTNPVQVNDLQQGCVTLISPTEEGWYTYTVTATDSVTGLSVSKTSQAYHVYATPPPA